MLLAWLFVIFVPMESPVVKELAPAYALELLLRTIEAVFPTRTVELGPTFTILKLPMMETTTAPLPCFRVIPMDSLYVVVSPDVTNAQNSPYNELTNKGG